MSQFIFKSYDYQADTGVATFRYCFDDGRAFVETAQFQPSPKYNETLLDRALFLAHLLIGASYFKTFPTPNVHIESGTIDEWQAGFLNKVYQEGMSQYAFESGLTRAQLAHFTGLAGARPEPAAYIGEGTLILQSGGKDSLLLAALHKKAGTLFTPWYVSSSDFHPTVLDDLGAQLVTTKRTIDTVALKQAASEGGKNGHVPVTYIVQSLALIQAILSDKNKILIAIGHEGEEPHAFINDLPVTHQWSKTWQAEQLFAQYVATYVSSQIQIGSPLRRYSELRVAQLFVERAWGQFGLRFSSCNRANYAQGADNSQLHWCGECPKCANSYLLFAPFVEATQLQSLFNGQDLFEKAELQQTFEGLLGINGAMKPFECVGEIDELRYAYGLAQTKGGYGKLSFAVPETYYDYTAEYPTQEWATLPL